MTRLRKSTTNAVEILCQRYIQGNPKREQSVKNEYFNAEIAEMIYELRKEAGLSQNELAALIGTTQSVISRLEDSDYDGHSLPMLERIAKALNKRVKVTIEAPQVREDTVHYAFRRLVQNARRRSGMTIGQASKQLDIHSTELERLESDTSHHPSVATLNKLSHFYGINQERLAGLAGAVKNVPTELKKQASKFAAEPEPCAKLSSAERKALDEFMQFLKNP
jgi:transcriptional regulator with XRE-family HTH domain